MRRKRPLTPEEERLWRQAMSATKPLSPSQKAAAAEARAKPKNKPTIATVPKGRHETPPHILRPDPAPKKTTPQPLHHLDRASAQKVRRGRIDVDGKIDLHGFRQAEAHDVLIRRLMAAQASGNKVMLVVTGKGRDNDNRTWGPEPRQDSFTGRGGGVLKAQVPLWLSQAPLRGLIHSVQEAHPRHGGSGALYVFLKRNRP